MDPPPEAVHAEPRKCIDRRPSSWFLITLFALVVALVCYVLLSALSVPDSRALSAAAISLLVIMAVLLTVNYTRGHTGRQNVWIRMGLKSGEEEVEEEDV